MNAYKKLLFFYFCIAAANCLGANEPAGSGLLKELQRPPEAFKLTYVHKERMSGYAAKIVQYQDGGLFHYERYLVPDKGDPVFDGAYQYDGVVHKHLYLGRMWVSRDADKIANGHKLFWSNSPMRHYYLPFLRLEENCKKLMDPKALQAAVSQIRLVPKAANLFVYADENADLVVDTVQNSSLRKVSGKMDGFDVEYSYAGVFILGDFGVPHLTTIQRKAIPGGWRGWEAAGEVHHTFELIESECAVKDLGFMKKDKIEIPMKLVKEIIDVDLGLDTPTNQ